MDRPPRQLSLNTRRTALLAVVVVGVVFAVLAFRDSRERERERAEAEFVRRTTVRHTLTREVLGRYQDALFALNSLFMLDERISRAEFVRAVRRIEERTPGAQAYEWVPAIAHAQRAETEAALARSYHPRPFAFTEFSAAGLPVRAADRPAYLPVAYVEPVTGNESALGYDLLTGPTRGELALARDSRQLTLTRGIRLAQEKTPDRLGLIMISAVWRPSSHSAPADPDVFVGYVQAVFRVHDLLERTRTTHPDTILDMLFVDARETDPALRLLYHRPADDAAPREPAPTEAEWRQGVHNELPIPIGGREWRVLYRPRPGWIEEQFTQLAWVRLGGVLALTALVAGLVHLLGRRTELVESVVETRTAELASSRRELASLLHALPGMAYRCRYDDELTVLYVSEGALALTGRPADDFVSGRAHFRELIHPDDLDRVRSTTIGALEDRRDYEVEYRIRLPAGTEKWVLSRGSGVYADEGALTAFEGLAIDITAQKHAEQDRLALERKLLESQKLESLGLLAGGIAHDFNNLLTGILGNASLARTTLAPGAPHEAQLRAIETTSLRAAELCKQMLAYAGKGRFVIEPVDLGTLATGLIPLLEISLARKARLRLELAPGLPPVLGDATQLRQIVMNLVLNAADAIAAAPRPDGGEIVLHSSLVQADHSLLAASVTGAGLSAGDYVSLEIRDNGCGMTSEVRAKIFDPFFTTKFAGRGLGLAAVLGIVRGHQGALLVDSEPGRGSTFRLLLPAAVGATPTRDSTPPFAPTDWRHSGHVLVIDDEETVRLVTARALETLGLTAVTAADGRTGLTLFRDDPTSFDLVILDLVMPGLNGEETLAALRAVRPEVRVLLVSGYNEGDLLRRLHSPVGLLGFLPKPFTRETLATHLRELLG